MAEFTFTAAIRGFHFYRHSWTPRIGQQLPMKREIGNPEDRFAIAVVDVIDGSCCTVGHILRELSGVLSHFMEHRGEITCGPRQCSPLTQGGLEIPSSVCLSGKMKLVKKAETLTGADPGFYEGGFFCRKMRVKRTRFFKATPTRALTTPVFDQG